MNTKEFFKFIVESTKENFLKSRESVITHEKYNAYSNDFEVLSKLMEQEKYEEVIAYNEINSLLSPLAHLVKRQAFLQMGEEKQAELELIAAQKILECIELTGEGTLENPYLITNILDERDFLGFLGERFASQVLIQNKEKSYDLITTESGKEIYFDITDAFAKLEKAKPAKKWWKIWEW